MKVLILNYTDAGGGAAIAAFRLAKSLNEHGVKTTLGVVEKQTASNFVIALPHTQNLKLVRYKTFAKNALKKILRKFFPHIAKIFLFNSTNTILHSTNKKSLVDVNWINNSDFDLVNLHWINNDMLSIKDISKIKKPLLWTMHDSWPCSGAEHHQNVLENDTRWKEGYYSSNKPLTTTGPDICKKVWNQKKKYLQNKKISFVCPSNWEKDVLKSSALFKNQTCYVVPNIIPSSIFFKKDKKNIRSLLDIPQNKKIIGFGAAENISDLRNRKGSYHLLEALTKLKNNEKYFLVIFGNASDAFTSKVPLPFFASGYVSNPKILSLLYNSLDVFVSPSLIENLPTTCLESIFCGVPVAAFDVGGTSDIVVHKKTGYLATPYKSKELAEGIEWCILHKTLLSKNCLTKAKENFSEDNIIKKMIDVYTNVLLS